jgi:RNA polymerase sigma-70 factor, ECF subfamily
MNEAGNEFEMLVNAHYAPAYRFALSLTRNESDAADLTQTAFQRLLKKLGTLRDPGKAKTWLFTTVYRLFLEGARRAQRFPHTTVDEAEISAVDNAAPDRIDAESVMAALEQIEEPFRSTLVLFYLEDHSYREIAEILNVPVGTVMSRLSRGKTLLRALLADRSSTNIIPLPIRRAQ